MPCGAGPLSSLPSRVGMDEWSRIVSAWAEIDRVCIGVKYKRIAFAILSLLMKIMFPGERNDASNLANIID